MEENHRENLRKVAKMKAAHYCAYQERTQQQVRDKLYSLGLYQDEVEEILTDLIVDNFINEERFALSFAQGKFRIKRWGKIKIKYHLEQLGLSDYCIARSLESIDAVEYKEALAELLAKKFKTASGKDSFSLNHKVAGFLIRKGYEPELVWQKIKSDY